MHRIVVNIRQWFAFYSTMLKISIACITGFNSLALHWTPEFLRLNKFPWKQSIRNGYQQYRITNTLEFTSDITWVIGNSYLCHIVFHLMSNTSAWCLHWANLQLGSFWGFRVNTLKLCLTLPSLRWSLLPYIRTLESLLFDFAMCTQTFT